EVKLLSASQRYLPRMSQPGAASRLPGKNRQVVSYLERYIFLEAGTCEHVRRVAFKLPVFYRAVRFFYVEVDMAVRVRPLDPGNYALEGDRLIRVIFSAEGMMRLEA